MKTKKSSFLSLSVTSIAGIAVGYLLVAHVRHEVTPEDVTPEEVTLEAVSDPPGGSSVDERSDRDVQRIEQGRGLILGNMERTPQDLRPMIGGGPQRLASSCEIGVDGSSESDAVALEVICASMEPSFGGWYQQINVEQYQGKKIKFSADLKATGIRPVGGVEGVGSLWVRIGVQGSGPVIDNGMSVGISETTGWLRREIEVDIPLGSQVMRVGFWMQGQGRITARNLNLELMN
jgi:hypothetical protein